MEREKEKRCPVCGERVIGRSDKKYCCDSCRIFAANKRGSATRGALRQSGLIKTINKDLIAIEQQGGKRCIKFIALVIHFCKILYKFET